MNYFNAIVLGFVQGLTEFLPISSSGHLILFSNFIGVHFEGIVLEIILHCGTLLSLLFFFNKKIYQIGIDIFFNKKIKYLFFLIIGIFPVCVVGLIFKSFIEKIFDNVTFVGIFLLITGLTLLFSNFFKRKKTIKMNFFTSLIIGFFQVLALLPGISRSGMTISSAIFLGIKPKEAANFSFLMSIPIIFGSMLISIKDIQNFNSNNFELNFLIISFFSSFIFGIISLKVLYNLINTKFFHYFGYYCILIGIFSIIINNF